MRVAAASRATGVLLLCALWSAGCGGDKQASNESPRAEITVTEDGDIYLPVDDCVTPPANELPEIEDFDQIQPEVGWTPLRAGTEYQISAAYGWRYAWTCSGAQAVLALYDAPGDGYSFLLYQGLRREDLHKGTLGATVTIGPHEVRFVEENDSVATFVIGTHTDGSTLYAMVDGRNHSEVEAFIRTLAP